MDAILKNFCNLSTADQVKFLKTGQYKNSTGLDKNGQIYFIKKILKTDLSSKTMASAIKTLRNLGCNDKYFYRKFMFHIDSSVSKAAKKAISECSISKDSDIIRFDRMLLEGKTEDRLLIVDFFLNTKGKLNEDALISFLGVDDSKVRQAIVKGITLDHKLDDYKLSEAIKHGTVWYVRAALVTILGNRKSPRLFDVVDVLVVDRNIEVRLALVGALAQFADIEAKEYLQCLAGDPFIWVRKQAQKILDWG